MTEEAIHDPETFYDEYGHAEWDRLDRSLHGRLEWDGTIEYLDRHLPESGRVLDAGGAAGRYTVSLAEQGYDVTLVDISDEQRAIAREKVSERGLEERVSIREGDIRDIGFDDDAFDATLCLGGPLSHVLDENERATAVTELRRVSAPGGSVFVSVMGRLNFLHLLLARGKRLDVLPELAETGDYDADLLARHDHESLFTETHFFRAAEFEELLESAGLSVDHLVGLEGVASIFVDGPQRETARNFDDGQREAVWALVNQQREDRTVTDLSAHMLAVCEAPDPA